MSESSLIKPTIDWVTWFLWVFVCAITPVINTIAVTAFLKPILQTDPDAESIKLLMLLLVFLPLSIPLLQGLVLRRIFRLSLITWTTVILIPACIWWCESAYWANINYFKIAVSYAKGDGRYGISFFTWLTMPWIWLLVQTILVGNAAAIAPSILLKNISGRKYHFFLIAAIAGMYMQNALNIIYNVNVYPTYSYALNNMPFSKRLEELFIRAILGAFFGAVSGAVLLALFQYEDFKNKPHSKYQIYRQPILMLGGAVLIAISTPVFIYLIMVIFGRRF